MWYAHSVKDRAEADWEPLSAHLHGVSASARAFAEYFGCGDHAALLGLLHDLGKYSDKFQSRLKGDAASVDHAFAGALIAQQRFGPLGRLLAYAIAGHHAGLADGRRREGISRRSPLDERLGKTGALDGAQKALAYAQADGLVLLENLRIAFPPGDSGLNGFRQMTLARMLFSALVDADFLETEKFYSGIGEEPVERGGTIPLTVLQSQLNSFLEEKTKTAQPSDINRLRAHILSSVRGKAQHPQGIFTLTVPTGGGKTLASLAFALDHAMAHGLRRVIIVIPYTSIIEQTAEVYRLALAPHSDAVLEHHSGFDEMKIDFNEGRQARDKLRLAAENWDAPVVVTTAVQFFESLFADRPSKCRKLHNIAKSVVIFDEAQTLPLGLLRPCVASIDELARSYRTSAIICTATQPAVLRSKDDRRTFAYGLTGAEELAPDAASLFEKLDRVTIEHAGKLGDEELAHRLAKARQVLCIVNTRKHARALFDQLRDVPGARHLSTLMCGEHRRNVLDEIRSDLKPETSKPCIVVSTTLIEAGVDVDFPEVWRAESGLDSIAQAAGRCNREGRNPRERSRTFIFEPGDEKPSKWYTANIGPLASAMRAALREFPKKPLSPPAIEHYFRRIYWQRSGGAGQPDGLDSQGFILRSNEGVKESDFPFDTFAAEFSMIEDIYVPVIVPYDAKARRNIRDLDFALSPWKQARALQRYTVGITVKERAELIRNGAARIIREKKFGDQFVALNRADIYDQTTGLNLLESWTLPDRGVV